MNPLALWMLITSIFRHARKRQQAAQHTWVEKVQVPS